MPPKSPQLLGRRKSFGFGDRLGMATSAHLAAARKYDFAPVFAQQSIRELSRTDRSHREVLRAAAEVLEAENYDGAWGADADHLKKKADVIEAANAGFTIFTIDPSEHVNDHVQDQPMNRLVSEVESLYGAGFFQTTDWDRRYLGQKFDVGGTVYRFDRESLFRAAAKYGRALTHYLTMARWIDRHAGRGLYETEISVDETTSPTSPLEHLFIGLELRHCGIPVASLAPRFLGGFESGIDYKGNLRNFEANLKEHAAIARYCGPYKISVHTGSDKFRIYRILGKVCGDRLHVKTAGTSYLEALRVLFRANERLFRELLEFCAEHFPEDRASYFVSTTEEEVQGLLKEGAATEKNLFDQRPGRQLLHVTYGSVLGEGKDSRGRSFREALLETLEANSQEYRQRLEAHFDKHLAALCQG